MSSFSEMLVNMLLPAIEELGAAGLQSILQKFHDSQPDEYKAAIIAGHAFVVPLKKYVGSTSNKVDDGLVASIDEAIVLSASTNGIVLD